jgi:hypothetical protein
MHWDRMLLFAEICSFHISSLQKMHTAAVIESATIKGTADEGLASDTSKGINVLPPELISRDQLCSILNLQPR